MILILCVYQYQDTKNLTILQLIKAAGMGLSHCDTDLVSKYSPHRQNCGLRLLVPNSICVKIMRKIYNIPQ